MDEFAYQVDTGWEDYWQRGFHAYKQALRCRESGDNQGAKEAFVRAIESLQQATFRASPTYLSLSFAGLADIFAAEQEWNSAIQAYQQSIFYSPKKEVASFLQLVRIWQQTGNDADYMLWQFDDMRSSFGATDPYLTSEPVFAFLDAGMVEPARRFLDSAPQEIDASPVILVARGRLCERMRDIECARQYYVRALPEMQEREPLVAAGLAASLAGQSEAAGNVPEATYYWELAVTLNPNATAYRTLLARTYKRNGELDKARHVLQEGLALQPEDGTLKQTLDELMGQLDEN